MTISDYLTHYLHQIGVTQVFGVSGANIEDFLDSIVKSGLITFILAKHEFSAACMADGYSRISNSLGVVAATSGGGSVNLVAGLAESLASQQPVLAILGMPPSTLEGKGAFQDSSGLNNSLNGEALFSTLASKYFHRFTSAENFSLHLERAVKAALTPPFGTAILMIPKDIQLQTMNDLRPEIEPINLTLHAIDQELIDACAETNGQVLIIAGEEVRRQSAENELISLAQRMNAVVAVTPEAKACFDNYDPRFVGISGVAGHHSVIDAAEQVQTLLIIGTRLQLMSRAGLEPYLDSKRIIYLNNSAPSYDFTSNAHVSCVRTANLKTRLQQLVNHLPQLDHKTISIPVIYEKPASFEKNTDSEFNFESICNRLNQFIADSDVIFVDAGNTGGAALHYLKSAAYFGIALGMGGMGYAIGASIGSCIKNGAITWCILGDGALLMHGMEIHTAIEHKLPMRFIVINNNAHAMCYDRDQLYLSGKQPFNVFQKSNYGAGFASMFPGFYSHDVHTLDELENHLQFLKDYSLPAFLSLDMDYREIPPFLPFLQRRRSQIK